jgi:hypothetical protein
MVMTQVPEVVQQKLDAFERIQAEFEECFRFKQDVHGQKRFSSFTIEEIVYYLHALWLCERKDRLLSVYKNIRRYQGDRCLELLRVWQEGQSAEVAAFLLNKLDMYPFVDVTAQIEKAYHQQDAESLVCILESGRLILVNRGVNLMHALETIAVHSGDDLRDEVRRASERYGHTPAQIEEQLAEMTTPLSTYRPHALLAQRNMMTMNRLGADVSSLTTEPSCVRSWYPTPAEETQAPFAEQVIDGYLPMLAPTFNNVRGVRFVDRTEPERLL